MKEKGKTKRKKAPRFRMKEEQQIRIKIKMSGLLLFLVRLNQTLTEETLFEVQVK